MPLIRRVGEAFAFENVSQMTSAASAGDLDALHAECAVHMAVNGAWNGVKECRPATA